MESLTEVAAKQARRLARRPDTPGWWPLLTVVLAVFFVGYIFWNLVSPTPSTAKVGGGVTTISTPVTVRGTTTPTTAVVASTVLPNLSGVQVQVPAAAASLADKAAVAYFTTNFKGIRLASGVTAPTLSQAYPNAAVSKTQVVQSLPTQGTYRVTVNPGAGSGLGPRYLSITVVLQGGQWAFSSGG